MRGSASSSLASLAVLALASLLISGCSEPEAPVQTAEPAHKLKVLFASATNNVPMMVAAENGYWRERGLDVTVQVLDSGSEIATALVTGAADIGAGNATSSVPLSRAAGNDFVIGRALSQQPDGGRGTERVGVIAAPRSRRQRRRAEVAGRQDRGVTEGSTNENYLRGYLEANGLSMDDIKTVNLSRAGHADRALAGQRRRGRRRGSRRSARSSARRATTPSCVSAAGRTAPASSASWSPTSYLAEHEDVLEQYVLGAWEGVQFTRENPEAGGDARPALHLRAQLEDAASGHRADEGRVRPAHLPVHARRRS